MVAGGRGRLVSGEGEWRDFLHQFHDERPGITEQVLTRAHSAGLDPYQWLIAGLPATGVVLDLAGGNGALTVRMPAPLISVVVDLSPAELAGARRRGLTRILQADATALPLADASVAAVGCSMALMLMPLRPVLAEISRVLQPGGVLVATLPATGPVTAGDALRYARLLLALRQTRLSYPNDTALRSPTAAFADHDLRPLEDTRRRFVFPVDSSAVGAMLLNSLYLPDVDPARLAAARRVAESWAGADLGIPLRRLTAYKGTGSR